MPLTTAQTRRALGRPDRTQLLLAAALLYVAGFGLCVAGVLLGFTENEAPSTFAHQMYCAAKLAEMHVNARNAAVVSELSSLSTRVRLDAYPPGPTGEVRPAHSLHQASLFSSRGGHK